MADFKINLDRPNAAVERFGFVWRLRHTRATPPPSAI
jgi:hypothetical protein